MSTTQTASHTFVIPALDCPEEYALINKGLAQLQGIRATAPDYLGRSLRVEFDPVAVDVAAISGRLLQIGFPAQLGASDSNRQEAHSLFHVSVRPTTILAAALLALAGAVYLMGVSPMFWRPALLVSTVLSGLHVARAAVRAIRLRAIDMNVLMTIAAIGAIATDEWFEAATAMLLFAISLWLESFTLGRARRAVRSLVELTPNVAHRLCRNSSEVPGNDTPLGCLHPEHHEIEDTHPDQIQPGDLLLVRPGERVPVDGVIGSGGTSVNQATLTGESMPVEKNVGDQLFAGSLNGEGTVELRATKTAAESTLAHVVRLVEKAQSARSTTERFVDQFARFYTPIVVMVALVIAFGPPLAGAAGFAWFDLVPFSEWLHRGLVLLVIACPCALVLSTPVTILCGLHQATRLGLIVKGGDFLERAGKLRCVAFDKTGTLTEGRPRLVDIRAVPSVDPDHVLRAAASLEAASEHPLAKAIVTAARERGWAVSRAVEATTVRGGGVEGSIQGKTYFIGSPRFVLAKTGEKELHPAIIAAQAGQSISVLGQNGRILGALYLADDLRPDAEAAVKRLRSLGIDSIVMLTGDSEGTANRIRGRLGMDHAYCNLLPQDKVQIVENLVSTFHDVAMVGDGVNDAPALAASRLGIAFGTEASDTALETADIVSLSPHLTRIPSLIELSRRTRAILGQNIALALSIKVAVLVLAAVGLGTLWAAVGADVGASMLVILNGMRALQPVTVEYGSGSSPMTNN